MEIHAYSPVFHFEKYITSKIKLFFRKEHFTFKKFQWWKKFIKFPKLLHKENNLQSKIVNIFRSKFSPTVSLDFFRKSKKFQNPWLDFGDTLL